MTVSGLHFCCVQTSILLNVRGEASKRVLQLAAKAFKETGTLQGAGECWLIRRDVIWKPLYNTALNSLLQSLTLEGKWWLHLQTHTFRVRGYQVAKRRVVFDDDLLGVCIAKSKLEHGIVVPPRKTKPECAFWCNNIGPFPICPPSLPYRNQ